jgi:hypothetical protein
MNDLELVLVLLAVAAGLAVIAERLRVPYPILLVLGGLALAVVPGLPAVRIDPWCRRLAAARSYLAGRLASLLICCPRLPAWADSERRRRPPYVHPAAACGGVVTLPPVREEENQSGASRHERRSRIAPERVRVNQGSEVGVEPLHPS